MWTVVVDNGTKLPKQWHANLLFSAVQSLGVIKGLGLENCTPIEGPQLPHISCQKSVSKTCLYALCHAM